MQRLKVRTPCIGVCSTGLGDTVCRGCKRFGHEVVAWNSYDNTQRAQIDQRLGSLLATCVSSKIHVLDAKCLARQLHQQQIAYPAHQDPHCWVVPLLRAGASQISDPAEYGLLVDAEFVGHSMADLRELIDRDFYALSCAHYERYIAPLRALGVP